MLLYIVYVHLILGSDAFKSLSVKSDKQKCGVSCALTISTSCTVRSLRTFVPKSQAL